jgi:hypothetical protein
LQKSHHCSAKTTHILLMCEGHGFRREPDLITGVNFALSAGTGMLTLTGSP